MGGIYRKNKLMQAYFPLSWLSTKRKIFVLRFIWFTWIAITMNMEIWYSHSVNAMAIGMESLVFLYTQIQMISVRLHRWGFNWVFYNIRTRHIIFGGECGKMGSVRFLSCRQSSSQKQESGKWLFREGCEDYLILLGTSQKRR